MTLFGQVEPPRGSQAGSYGTLPLGRLIKAGAVGVGALIVLFLFFNYIAALTRSGAGYTGVEILLSGSQRGPSEIPIRTGWVFYSPLRSQISDLETFTHGVLRDTVRNSLNEVASTYTIEQIYGEEKASFLHKVQALIQEKVAPVGVVIQQFGFIGAPRVPDVIAQAITAKAQAIQHAEQARNELAETQAQAAKQIAQADGEAKSAVTRAQGEAEANRIRQTSITPQLLELRRLENQRALVDKWNGQLPTVETNGSNGMMLQLPKPN